VYRALRFQVLLLLPKTDQRQLASDLPAPLVTVKGKKRDSGYGDAGVDLLK